MPPVRAGLRVTFMWRYLLHRMLIAVPVLVLVTLLVFLTVNILPGDPALMILGQEASPQALEAMRARLGLDQPLHMQYLHWVGGILQGDLGRSMVDGSPVSRAIKFALPVTLQLAVMALIIALIIGVPAGIVSATRRGTVWDALASFIALAGISMPGFWVAILLIYGLSLLVPWFPSSGFVRLGEDWVLNLHHAFLPAVALGIRPAGVFMRQVRSAMLEVIRADYVRTARAKGLTEKRITYRHALRNALIPLTTIGGVELAQLLGNVIVIDIIFGVPGFGRLIYSSILRQDLVMLQSVVLVFAVAVVLVNLAVDVTYGLLDPRIKYDS